MFVTANHIKPEWHIRMQAAFQEYNDSRHLQDLQLRARRHRGVRRGDLPAGLRARTARASRSTATAAATCRCSRPAPPPRRCRSRRDGAGDAAARRRRRAEIADLHGELAELEAENERLQRMRATSSRRRTSSAAQKRSRPEMLRGTTRRLETPLGTMFVTITEDDRASRSRSS